MPTRTAHAEWNGPLDEGKGTMAFGSGAYEGAYSFRSRMQDGPGTNPEELFAAGYSACFQGALAVAGGKREIDTSESEVTARVQLTPPDMTLSVELDVMIPGVDAETAKKLAESAHRICPYSRATQGNIEVTLSSRPTFDDLVRVEPRFWAAFTLGILLGKKPEAAPEVEQVVAQPRGGGELQPMGLLVQAHPPAEVGRVDLHQPLDLHDGGGDQRQSGARSERVVLPQHPASQHAQCRPQLSSQDAAGDLAGQRGRCTGHPE